MINLNDKEKRILSITLAGWGIFLIGSGLIMNAQVKPIINTEYSLSVKEKKIAETQAKTNEIKLKDMEIEINNPISVDVKDYLEDVDNISESIIKILKLDTSLVNINEPGTYQYTITYKKKKYIGNIKVKDKELPNVTFTLKTIKIKTGEALSSNPRSFIKETIPDEVYNNLTLDISKVDNTKQGNYTYYIIYKGVTYQGRVEVTDPTPTVISKGNQNTNTNTNTNDNTNTNTNTTTDSNNTNTNQEPTQNNDTQQPNP